MDTEARQFAQMYKQLLVPEGEYEQEAEAAVLGIVERYTEPWRHYHTVAHLGHMAAFLFEHIDQLHSPETVFKAAIAHDSVYVPQLLGGVNEELSAQLLLSTMGPYCSRSELNIAAKYVRATIVHESHGGDTDLDYFLDSDMLIVGTDEETYDRYDRGIRQEFGFVPLDRYREARLHVLTGFNKRTIYFTEAAAQYEDQAHTNIERSIRSLSV